MQYSFGCAIWYARFVLRLLGQVAVFLIDYYQEKCNLSSRIILYFLLSENIEWNSNFLNKIDYGKESAF
mgnify:CR=1 FL=1